MDAKSIHQFTVKNAQGEEVDLKQYEGKVLMIVNTASKCGFTPQLTAMQELYKEYKNQDFELLAFPSNDFLGQEPLSSEEAARFCILNYYAEYPIFEKTNVKGSNASELFQFLSNKELNGKISSVPRWNFHKYLIDKNGQVVDYFYTTTSPTSNRVKNKIDKLLNKNE